MEKILVSACLLGDKVRYNGADAITDDPVLRRWLAEGRVVRFCPEVAGGLGTPRPPAERQADRIVTDAGADVTVAFMYGAELARDTARAQRIRIAILKDGSPSCGSTYVYDGTFTGTRVSGAGTTTAMLNDDGVRVFNETQLQDAAAYLAQLEELDINNHQDRYDVHRGRRRTP
jgi:uncharacterized protein YbbK (DUF523 family)